jgi:hypothetical protein
MDEEANINPAGRGSDRPDAPGGSASHPPRFHVLVYRHGPSRECCRNRQGEIFGLTAGITSSATNVIVESYPAGLEPPAPPITVFTNIVINTFSVNSMGTITDAQYLAFDTTGSVSLELNAGDITNALTTSDDTEPPRDIINVSGFPGVTYTPAPIPEPSSVTILGTGLGLAALWLLRQRRRRRWATA